MGIQTVPGYGNNRDFMARFNAPDYSPWGACVEKQLTPEQAAYEAKKEANRQAWHRQKQRKNELARIARAKGAPLKTQEEQVLRVNAYSPICAPSGLKAQAAEIRAEMRKTKAASGAN